MIECKLVKFSQSNKIYLTDMHRDLFDNHSVKVGLDITKYEEMLAIQDKYNELQKELKFLFNLHGGE